MSNIKLFEDKQVRTYWDEIEEQWYFSIVDVVEVLTNSSNPRDYWFKMKVRVKIEDGLELSTICRQLKLKATDGKMRETDCANTQNLLRKAAHNRKINANFLFGGFIVPMHRDWCVNEHPDSYRECFVSIVVRDTDSYRYPQINSDSYRNHLSLMRNRICLRRYSFFVAELAQVPN